MNSSGSPPLDNLVPAFNDNALRVLQMRSADVAYSAGLFDGEGCVEVNVCQITGRRSPQFALRCTVAMTNSAAVNSFKAFGGFVTLEKLRPRRKQIYRWSISGAGAAAFLQLARPYFKVKAKEAWLALEYWEQQTPSTSKRNGLSDSEVALRTGFSLAIKEAKRGA